jgi:hypothetical protein
MSSSTGGGACLKCGASTPAPPQIGRDPFMPGTALVREPFIHAQTGVIAGTLARS